MNLEKTLASAEARWALKRESQASPVPASEVVTERPKKCNLDEIELFFADPRSAGYSISRVEVKELVAEIRWLRAHQKT